MRFKKTKGGILVFETSSPKKKIKTYFGISHHLIHPAQKLSQTCKLRRSLMRFIYLQEECAHYIDRENPGQFII